MWRPFTSIIVTHSFGHHAKKHAKPLDQKKPRRESVSTRNRDLEALFPNNTPADEVAVRMSQFEQLQEKVAHQRTLIELQEKVHQKRKQKKLKRRRASYVQLQLKKTAFRQSLRAMASAGVKPASLTTRVASVSPKGSRIFALTTTGSARHGTKSALRSSTALT